MVLHIVAVMWSYYIIDGFLREEYYIPLQGDIDRQKKSLDELLNYLMFYSIGNMYRNGFTYFYVM